jgi:hypothetical protein
MPTQPHRPERGAAPRAHARSGAWALGGLIAIAILLVAFSAWAQDAPSLLDAPPQAVSDAPESRTGVLLRTVVGLLALLTLAYLGGHRRVRALEERLGLSQVITAGLPFIVLGAVARQPSVGVLTNGVLAELGPLLRLALGWLGFLAGFRFDLGVAGERTRRASRPSLEHIDVAHTPHERVSSLPLHFRAAQTRSMFSLAAGRAVIAFVVIGAAMALALFALEGFDVRLLSAPTFYRDAALFGVVGALASGTPRPEDPHAPHTRTRLVVLRRVQDIVGVVGLLLITAYFRSSDGVTFWQLPGTAWLLLALGLGTTIGFVAYVVLARAKNADAEAMVLLLGTVAFTAGIAGYLRLSPLVVCFLAGLIVANLPAGRQPTTLAVLERVERPIYLIFLVVAGALWIVPSVYGWLLMIAFVVMRLLGQSLGLVWARRNGMDASDTRSALESPMGALSIAVVISAQVLFSGGALPLLMTSVLGGVLAGELLSQVATRVRGRRPAPPEGPAAGLERVSAPRADSADPVRESMESMP